MDRSGMIGGRLIPSWRKGEVVCGLILRRVGMLG